METKICKACKESIAAEASKCPKCQSFQSKFLNPSIWSLLFLLLVPLFWIPFYLSEQDRKIKYLNYQDKIQMTVLRKDTLQRESCKDCDLLNILVELDNQTDIAWEVGEFDVEFLTKEGELLNIEKQGVYQLKLHPNSSSKASIKVPIYKEYSNTEVKVKLVNLKKSWN